MMRRPDHSGSVPFWMGMTSPGHHYGGICDGAGFAARGPYRSEYERRGDPPAVDHAAYQRKLNTYRETVVHVERPERPPLNYTQLPPRRQRRHWFDVLVGRLLGLDAELLP